jgi:tetraacyldisaccharide 4'-kinase
MLRRLLNPYPYRSRATVVCVGGISTGGSGKTPVAIEIAKILRDNYKIYCFLTKGYGGRSNGITKLSAYNTNAYIVGDEALLLFEYGDTFVSRNKAAGLKYIDSYYSYDYIIVDDGLQNPTFTKNRKILVIDCESEFNNNLYIPAGPLRESFSNIVRRNINLVLLIGEDKHNVGGLCDKYSLTRLRGVIKPIADSEFSGKYVAVCGIAHPEKFRRTLTDSNIEIVDFIAFGDHHRYTDGDLEKARKSGYDILTTKKDWVKIKNLNIDRSKIHVLDIFIDFEDRAVLENVLLSN